MTHYVKSYILKKSHISNENSATIKLTKKKKIIKIISVRKGLPKIRKARLTDGKKERNSARWTSLKLTILEISEIYLKSISGGVLF